MSYTIEQLKRIICRRTWYSLYIRSTWFGKYCIDLLDQKQFRRTNEGRAALIAQVLETPEGRSALASAMVAPLRRTMEYQSVGRQLLTIDELPQGAYASYERFQSEYQNNPISDTEEDTEPPSRRRRRSRR